MTKFQQLIIPSFGIKEVAAERCALLYRSRERSFHKFFKFGKVKRIFSSGKKKKKFSEKQKKFFSEKQKKKRFCFSEKKTFHFCSKEYNPGSNFSEKKYFLLFQRKKISPFQS